MILLLLALLFGTAAANDCGAYSPSVTCSSKVLVVLDLSNRLTPSLRPNEFTNARNVISQLNSNGGQQIGITYLGGGDYPMPQLNSNYDSVCAQFDSVVNASSTNSGKTASISTLFQSIYNTYGNSLDTVLLYSAIGDWNDIDFAGHFIAAKMPHLQVAVMSFYAMPSNWIGFQNIGIIYISPYDIENRTISNCFAGLSCGDNTKCTGLSQFFAPPDPVATTTPDPNIFTGQSKNLGCASSCDPSKVSSDVILLIENTPFTGKDGLTQIQNFIKTAFAPFNVKPAGSKDSNYLSVGIYVYSDVPHVVKQFGSVTANDLQNLNLPYSSENQTDMMDAIWDAESDLKSSSHRPNAARVIVFFATEFVSGNSRYPGPDFEDFIQGGGKIIVYELDKPGMNDFVFGDLTSPMYHVNSSDPNAVSKFQKAMCAANCICPSDSKLYYVDPISNAPTAGCYVPSLANTNYATANNKCQARGGFVAEAQDEGKGIFLTTIEENHTFYMGLKWDNVSNNWVWADGRPLNTTYSPWKSGPSHTTGTDCVVISQGRWVQTDCRNGYPYVCQIPPCDTNNLC